MKRSDGMVDKYGLSTDKAILLSFELERLSTNVDAYKEFEDQLDKEREELEYVKVKREDLREILEALEFIGCQFFACPGPDVEPVDMATCVGCSAVRKLKQILGENE